MRTMLIPLVVGLALFASCGLAIGQGHMHGSGGGGTHGFGGGGTMHGPGGGGFHGAGGDGVRSGRNFQSPRAYRADRAPRIVSNGRPVTAGSA